MVRSNWKKALVISLAWAGLAWGQQPTPSSGPAATSGPNAGQSFTVQEAGKPGQRCRVIKTWRTTDGKTAYQVQAVDSGEMMTIVESGSVRTLPASSNGSSSRVQAVATRIFHWGSDRVPPAGTPVPPMEYVQTVPSPAPRPMFASTPTSAAAPPTKVPATTPAETAKPLTITHPWPTQTTTYAPSVPRTTDARIVQAPTSVSAGNPPSSSPASQPQSVWPNSGTYSPQKTSPSTSSVTSSTTAVPDNRFSSTPITQPKNTFQNTPLNPPAVTVQTRPATTPDKVSNTSAPTAAPALSSSWSSTPTTSSSTPRSPSVSTWPSQATAAPQRVVQVVPSKSDALLPTPTSSTTLPAAAPKSTIASGQTTPVTPSSKPTAPLTYEMKPADKAVRVGGQPSYLLLPSSPATNVPAPSKTFTSLPSPVPSAPVAQVPAPAFPPYPSSPTVTPAPALTPANPPAPKSSALSVPTSSYWPQSNSQSTTTATPYIKGFDTPKSTTTTLWSSTDKPAPKTTVTTPTTATAAPPTDWRQSWGKTDNSKPAINGNVTQTSTDSKPIPAKPALPQADGKRPDPLQTPERFNPPPEQKPSAQKSDTMLVPALATSSATTLKPVATPVAPLTKANSPIGSTIVPLGAQSVIQAGDPGPGGVRYLPVPMVTIPDVRRAPAPPMMNSAQVYGASGNIASPASYAQANAFAPGASSPAYSQTANAFGPMGQPLPVTPASPSPSMYAGNGTVARGGYAATGNTMANPNVLPVGYQEIGPASQTVASAYHSTGYQGSPANPALSPVRTTPDTMHQMEIALRDSLYPSQRELAAQSLATADWHSHPMVVQLLTTAAKDDPAPTVRATCIRCLANMHVSTGPVLTVVRGLKNDTDPRVRQEAERALSMLAAGEK